MVTRTRRSLNLTERCLYSTFLVNIPTSSQLDKDEMKELFEQNIPHKIRWKCFVYLHSKAQLLKQMELPALWGRPKCIRLLY